MSVYEQFKDRQRAVWGAGDWPEIAKTIQDVSDQVVERAGIAAGHDVLDVATGSGNAAIRAAERGATVTGLDLVPENVEAARRRADEAGLDATWVEGDAEDLPFDDDSFDRVVSVFGAMFAPRHDVAAGELARVARPGGLVVVTGWTPEGLNGQMFATLGKHLPPMPPEIKPPLLWGVEDHMRELFAPSGGEVSFERRMLVFEEERDIDEQMEYVEKNLGPVVLAKAALEPQGKWDEARADLKKLYADADEGSDGIYRSRAEYLMTVVQLPG